MAWTTSAKVIEVRRKSAIVDVVVETLDGFRRHLSGRNAAVLAYYGFFTLFPLLMAATTVLGFVLQDDPQLQADIVDSAISQIPIIGPDIQNSAGDISGNWWALIVGLAIATWSSLKAFVGIQSAFDDSWEVDVDDRANGIVQRGKALIGILVIGLSQVGTVVLAALVGQAGLPRIGQVLLVLGGVAINVVVVATMYRFLTSRDVSWEMVWPGAVVTGLVYTVLQFVGANLMTNTLKDAQDVYGAFAGTLALLTWLSLHALVSLYGAELNTAIQTRRDRGGPPASPDAAAPIAHA
jgi:membrane protein